MTSEKEKETPRAYLARHRSILRLNLAENLRRYKAGEIARETYLSRKLDAKKALSEIGP